VPRRGEMKNGEKWGKIPWDSMGVV
jgi:hypothetical protein